MIDTGLVSPQWSRKQNHKLKPNRLKRYNTTAFTHALLVPQEISPALLE